MMAFSYTGIFFFLLDSQVQYQPVNNTLLYDGIQKQ
jgi:hypothetical protein